MYMRSTARRKDTCLLKAGRYGGESKRDESIAECPFCQAARPAISSVSVVRLVDEQLKFRSRVAAYYRPVSSSKPEALVISDEPPLPGSP
jgi:hypothetical protein